MIFGVSLIVFINNPAIKNTDGLNNPPKMEKPLNELRTISKAIIERRYMAAIKKNAEPILDFISIQHFPFNSQHRLPPSCIVPRFSGGETESALESDARG